MLPVANVGMVKSRVEEKQSVIDVLMMISLHMSPVAIISDNNLW